MAHDISEIYKTNSNFLKAADIKGARPVVQIADYEVGTVGDEKRPQVVLSFTGKEKRLGLNKTNAERLWVLSGSKDPGDWIGGWVRLLVDPSVEFQGKKVDAIRISQEYWKAPERKSAAAATVVKSNANSQPQPPDPDSWSEYQSEPTDDSQNDNDVPF